MRKTMSKAEGTPEFAGKQQECEFKKLEKASGW